MQARIRPYAESDSQRCLEIFIQAVTVLAAVDYTAEQIAAWSRPEHRRIDEWHGLLAGRETVVAALDDKIVGFSDVDDSGHINMLFVDPLASRMGIGTTLLTFIENKARGRFLPRLTADVSITAKPLFERSGFVVRAKQQPVLSGVQLTNYRMEKLLD